jgi:hypothetical protein
MERNVGVVIFVLSLCLPFSMATTVAQEKEEMPAISLGAETAAHETGKKGMGFGHLSRGGNCRTGERVVAVTSPGAAAAEQERGWWQ